VDARPGWSLTVWVTTRRCGRPQALGPKVGVGRETLREWAVQARVDQGHRQGPTSEERAEMKRLKAENRDLKEANEILKAASIFFARELCPPHR
jgi:transposase